MLSLCAREKLKTFDNMVATSKYLTLFAVKFAQINECYKEPGVHYNQDGLCIIHVFGTEKFVCYSQRFVITGGLL